MDAQQNYFNELAEKMMKKEITTEQACSLFKDFCDAGNAEETEALEDDLANAEKEVEELKESNEKLEGVLNLLTYFNKKLKEEDEELKKENEELKKKMEYLELNNWTVFCEVQKYGLDARCAECGYSTQGRKIRGVWDNVLCEDCGEHSEDEE